MIFKSLVTVIGVWLFISYATASDLQTTNGGNPLLMKRFEKPVADHSGKVVTDLQFLADREAIRNTIAAYGHALDDDYFDEYMEYFIEDSIMQISGPCFGNIQLNGKAQIRFFVDKRFPGRREVYQGRHTQAMIHIVEQMKDSALVRTQAFLGGTRNDGHSAPSIARAAYSFWLAKLGDNWKVKKMYIEVDGPLAIPRNDFPEEAWFEADDRAICEK